MTAGSAIARFTRARRLHWLLIAGLFHHPVPGERPLTLPRTARIQRTGEFAEIRERGRRIARGCLVANWVRLGPDTTSKVGVVTSRKVGIAVERSRARRLLRETFRLHQRAFREPVALVLVARPSIQGKSRQAVERDFLAALTQGGVLPPVPTAGSGQAA